MHNDKLLQGAGGNCGAYVGAIAAGLKETADYFLMALTIKSNTMAPTVAITS